MYCGGAPSKKSPASQRQHGASASPRYIICVLLLLCPVLLIAQPKSNPGTNQAVLVELEGVVEVAPRGTMLWALVSTNRLLSTGDRVRTGPRSRAVIRLSPTTTKRLGERTIYLVPPPVPQGRAAQLLKGLLYLFHRDKPGSFPVETPSAYAVVLGTEFVVEVAEDNTTLVSVIDGVVSLTNEFGRLKLTNGQSGIVRPGQPPAATPALESANVVQWCLYYPAILDPDEIELTAAQLQALTESLRAYRDGDLQAALSRYPENRQPDSDSEKIYLAALLLAVGKVDQSESLLASLAPPSPNPPAHVAELTEALRTLIAAVKFQQRSVQTDEKSATSLLASSWYEQAQAQLPEALRLARQATQRAPKFGFAWTRVAELEFGFGHLNEALNSLRKALEFTPRNAEAFALRGFVLTAQNRITEALSFFDQAIAIDGALGNAWLGRGLCKIQKGDVEGGRADIQVAATLEPQRALLRSYLGKAFSNEGDDLHATRELDLAKHLDSRDPTAWLYSALLARQQNRINEAIRDLQQSEALNENRRVYRSRLLLDQDRAVREANLANLYEDAGMTDLAAREAGRAVAADPANYSTHLFLGNSFQAQRDLKGINQRFETPAVTEYLLANLLSPVGAGTLAQSVSQQEYSRLFSSDGVGVASSTEYFSNGDWIEQGAQYGAFGNFGYAFSAFYRSDNGQRANNNLEQRELSLQLKAQLTPQDSLYFRTILDKTEAGDLLQRYDPGQANTGLKVREHAEPILLTGYHREWGPGLHTLVLGGWFSDELRVTDPQQGILFLGRDPAGAITDVLPLTIEQTYRNETEFFTVEAQQLWQNQWHTLIGGGRYQSGDFSTENLHSNPSLSLPFLFPGVPESVSTDFERWSLYSYYQLHPIEPLSLVAGLSYDALDFPENFRFAPLSGRQTHRDQLSPKAGMVLQPLKKTTLRFGYSKSLGGVGFDQSFRLEPTQIAGFNQSFRSLIPESVAAANVAAKFETLAASLEQQFGSSTFIGVSAELLKSKVARQIGAYDVNAFTITPGETAETLNYREEALLVTLNQLVGDEWAFGARYRVSKAELKNNLTEIPDVVAAPPDFKARNRLESVLHNVNLYGIYNHPSGFFGQLQSLWYSQNNSGYTPGLPTDDFWQLNLFAGYRFLHRRAEVRFGLLNLTDQDYRISPLNVTPELPRHRMFMASLKFNF